MISQIATNNDNSDSISPQGPFENQSEIEIGRGSCPQREFGEQ